MNHHYTRLFLQERQDFCDLLETLDPHEWQAGTLDEGWTIEDLTAHMLLRERRPLLFGLALASKGQIGSSMEKLMEEETKGGHASIIARLRNPPLLTKLPGLLPRFNLLEAYIHAEDARRGPLDRRREAPDALQEALWTLLKQGTLLFDLRLRSLPSGGRLKIEWPRHGTFTLSAGKKSTTGAAAVLSGEPGELLLWLSGRPDASDMELHGSPALVEALRSFKLGL